ncbi:hypothetical protein H310_02598 [Aphanomyces invadans]|uniref:Uncharacterized protein n=1 Tax=Aphanomyces invadans TaxID=157072 RepID=A0A024UJ42_9STRA|nr:hypothetical protein H310_02598 [Aphanomyces invadans]ETW06314.1 hypothetical protein H310_02598 [Aphanomyces invadans]|eukprot:XP_008864389.1 hypothetical protein H310_02598 [Aphanomyces invadans]
MMKIQRNDVDDLMFNGLGTPELWHNLSEELQGVKVLEHPRVQKKVLVKAIRMQTMALRCMAGEFDQLRDRLEAVEKEAIHGQKQLEKVNTKVLALEAALDGAKKRVVELEADIAKEAKRIDAVEHVDGQLKASYADKPPSVREDLKAVDRAVEAHKTVFDLFVAKVDHDMGTVKAAVDATNASIVAIETKLEQDEQVQVLTTDDIVHGNLPLSRWFEQYAEDNDRREAILKDTSDKFAKQSRGIHDMMNDTRKALDDNTTAVEDVQRALIDKADRVKVDLIIESKYEEIIEQLQKAMTAISDDEDEFKRNCRDLQDLVQNLAASKADKKDLLEVKEQVLYDSRVRQQVENLRAFIDLKMNREDVLSALKNKADKDEMQLLLKTLSDSMYAAVSKSAALSQEPDSAFLTKNSMHKRPGSLPSLEKDRCLACNSVLAPGHPNNSGPPMGSTYGGGFQTAAPGYEKGKGTIGPKPQPLPSLNFDSYLLGMDGHVYHGDADKPAVVHHTSSSDLLCSKMLKVVSSPNQNDRNDRPRSSGGRPS